jgi:trichothecene 3-O-acetyltransferase
MVTFTRAIDGRTALGIPSSYMGHLIHHSIVSLPLGQVASSPLSTVAQTLRRALNATKTPWAICSYATFIAREPDKSQLVYDGLHDVNIDLGATSVVASAGDEAASTLPDTYGLLGRACFVCRPNVSPIVGTITITPAEGGALPIALCLPEIDLEALKKDVEWGRHTRYVG